MHWSNLHLLHSLIDFLRIFKEGVHVGFKRFNNLTYIFIVQKCKILQIKRQKSIIWITTYILGWESCNNSCFKEIISVLVYGFNFSIKNNNYILINYIFANELFAIIRCHFTNCILLTILKLHHESLLNALVWVHLSTYFQNEILWTNFVLFIYDFTIQFTVQYWLSLVQVLQY